MVAKTLYCIARTGSGRPTLQHKLPPGVATETCCGLNISLWSIAYQNKRIPEILCMRKGCRG